MRGVNQGDDRVANGQKIRADDCREKMPQSVSTIAHMTATMRKL